MMQKLTFKGTRINKNAMVGTIDSKELVKSFNVNWIPDYQRDRIISNTNIQSLKKIFKTGNDIDSLKISFTGNVGKNTSKGAALNGTFSVIDGQQRLFALKETGANNLKIPVELYINIDSKKEIELFKQYNADGSKLKTGDLLKCGGGSVGLMNKRFSKENTLPFRVLTNKSRNGMRLAQVTRLEFIILKKLTAAEFSPLQRPSLKTYLTFVNANYPENVCALIEKSLHNLLASHLEMFGEYDSRATAYSNAFFFAWFGMMINNFLTKNGDIDFGTFKNKVLLVANSTVRNAKIKELSTIGTDYSTHEIYRMITAMMNHKNHKNKIKS